MAKINGAIAQKLQTLDNVLAELQSWGTLTVEALEQDRRTWRAVERNLQILVEVVIDVCQRLVVLAGQSPAVTGNDAIERCMQLGILSPDDTYRQMVRFRNFIVHRYEHVNPAILVDIVNERLDSFQRFRDEVLAYVRAED